jgi:hypothetical protein
MGLEIERDEFADEDYAAFEARLADGLDVLRELLGRPGFGVGDPSLGAELEVALIDRAARPLPLNLEVLAETVDPRMTFELDRFNLECNLRHTDLRGRPFDALRAELEDARRELERAAAVHGGRVVMVGILPTVRESDLTSSALTPSARYRALARALRGARSEPFVLDIAGEDPLHLDCDEVTFEGAATSLQIHLRVDPDRFAATFNAAQLATAPALAVAGNSPTFLGHRLWDETRVALFKQAVDDRTHADRAARQHARVHFGLGWIETGALELFASAIEHYPVLLPKVFDEDPREEIEAGRVPRLGEIRLHQGTVWHWNRPVYDPADGGHLRIELRALPSGPTVEDILANTAFLVGLTLGLAPDMEAVADELDFETAHANFYRAAQSGLGAALRWPVAAGGGDDPASARELVGRLVERAAAGLAGVGADPAGLLDVVSARAERAQTGAVWQRRALAALESTRSRDEALRALVEHYHARSREGGPVHTWTIPG